MQHIQLEITARKYKIPPARNNCTRELLSAFVSKTLGLDLEIVFPPFPQLKKVCQKEEQMFGPCNCLHIKYKACSGII